MEENIRYGIRLLFKDEIKKEYKEKKDLAKREKKCIKHSIKGFDKYMFSVLIRSYKYIIIYIDENIDIAGSIPDGCGIYLFNTDLGHYIGSSLNIKERIMKHRYKYDIKSVNVYLTDKLCDARIIENELILRCRPELNKLK